MEYHLQEGTLELADGFQDRTVNMFVIGTNIPAPLSITVSRDNLLPGESLSTYVDRQVKLITAKLRGYTVLGRREALLSSADRQLQGFQIDAHYLSDGRPLYQRQAAFELVPGRALVFSTTSQSAFDKRQDQDWEALLTSFQPRLAESDGTPEVE